MTGDDIAATTVWVRMPADRSTPAGPPQRCLANALAYAIGIGYEPCDAPAAIVAQERSATAPTGDVPVAHPSVTTNEFKPSRSWKGERRG
jgi:hypothetical protein